MGRSAELGLDRARASSLGVERLSPASPVLDKSLVIDLSTLSVKGLPERRQPQPTPLLDHYEGTTLAEAPDGRSILLLVSDDNGHAWQFVRRLVLSLGSLRGLASLRRRASPRAPGEGYRPEAYAC